MFSLFKLIEMLCVEHSFIHLIFEVPFSKDFKMIGLNSIMLENIISVMELPCSCLFSQYVNLSRMVIICLLYRNILGGSFNILFVTSIDCMLMHLSNCII